MNFSNLLMVLICGCIGILAKEQNNDENKPYEFGFNIEGEQHRHEKKDERGIINGEFGFITADGVYHVTVYATDEKGNFKILSMKNIRVRPYPTLAKSAPTTSTQRSTSPQITNSPNINRSTPPGKTGRACSSCKIPDPPQSNANDDTIEEKKILTPADVKLIRRPSQRPQGVSTAQNSQTNIPQGPGSKATFNGRPNLNAADQPSFNAAGGNQNEGAPNDLNSNGVQSNVDGKSQGSFQPNSRNNNEKAPTDLNSNGVQSNDDVNSQGGFQPNSRNHNEKAPTDFTRNSPGVENNDNSQGSFQSNPNSKTGANRQDKSIDLQNRGSAANADNFDEDIIRSVEDPQFSNINSNKPVLVAARMKEVPQSSISKSNKPGEREGLPTGLEKKDMEKLLYTFNYTLGFHGHKEEGYLNGAKKGHYFITGRNGERTRVDYIADENGFRPTITKEVLDVLSDEVPKPETEKDEKYAGLKHYEFKWLYYPPSP